MENNKKIKYFFDHECHNKKYRQGDKMYRNDKIHDIINTCLRKLKNLYKIFELSKIYIKHIKPFSLANLVGSIVFYASVTLLVSFFLLYL